MATFRLSVRLLAYCLPITGGHCGGLCSPCVLLLDTAPLFRFSVFYVVVSLPIAFFFSRRSSGSLSFVIHCSI
ncbi:hypothetical protein B0H14DRAFT_2854540, partial [Mycena olivaceomarginata]